MRSFDCRIAGHVHPTFSQRLPTACSLATLPLQTACQGMVILSRPAPATCALRAPSRLAATALCAPSAQMLLGATMSAPPAVSEAAVDHACKRHHNLAITAGLQPASAPFASFLTHTARRIHKPSKAHSQAHLPGLDLSCSAHTRTYLLLLYPPRRIHTQCARLAGTATQTP